MYKNSNYPLKFPFYHFIFNVKNKAGRKSGRIILRTRGKKHSIMQFSINNKNNIFYLFGIIIGTRYSFALNKFLNCIKYSNGSSCIRFAVESNILGDFINCNLLVNLHQFLYVGCCSFLELIPLRRIFCNMQETRKFLCVAARANGTFSYILYRKKDINLIACILPTGKTILLGNFVTAILGRVAGK